MENLMVQIILVSAIAPSCFAGQQSPAPNSEKNQEGQNLPKPRPITKGKVRVLEWGPPFIKIWHGQWHATINRDGSGTFGYGAPLGIPFGPKTFDVQAIDKELRPRLVRERPSSVGDIYGVTYFTKDEPKGTYYYTKGPEPIAEIFELFRQACKKEFSSGYFVKLWRKHPPTPVSNPWNEEEVIFRKPLDGGQEIVVIRGPDRPASDVKAVVPEAALQGLKVAFSARVELRTRDKATFLLSSRLVLEKEILNPDFGGFEVLDALVGHGQVILATAENGEIMFWQIDPLGSVHGVLLRRADWTTNTKTVPLGRNYVKAALGWTKDGLVAVEVDDLRSSSKQHTRFIQAGKEWEFKKEIDIDSDMAADYIKQDSTGTTYG